MSNPISARTRQRSSAPLLSVKTTLTRPSSITKRTPTSKSHHLSASTTRFLLTPSSSSSSSSALSSISLRSALSFSPFPHSSTATTPASSLPSPAASKAIIAAAHIDGLAPSSAVEACRVMRRKERVVLWPSQLYSRAEMRRSLASDSSCCGSSSGSDFDSGSECGSSVDGGAAVVAEEESVVGGTGGAAGELGGYLAALQGVMSRSSSVAASSVRGTPDV